MATTASSFYVTGGTLRQDAPSYVERKADTDLYVGLLKGEYCYVLHARQMGKSSPRVRRRGQHFPQRYNRAADRISGLMAQ